MEVDVSKVLGYVQFGHRERHLEGARVREERYWRVVETAGVVAEATKRDSHVLVGHVEDLQLSKASVWICRLRGGASCPTRVQIRLCSTCGRLAETHVVQTEADTLPKSGLKAVQTSDILRSTAPVQEDVPWGQHFPAPSLEDSRTKSGN